MGRVGLEVGCGVGLVGYGGGKGGVTYSNSWRLILRMSMPSESIVPMPVSLI